MRTLKKVMFKVHKSGFFSEDEDLTKMVDKTVELSDENADRFFMSSASEKETLYDSWQYSGSDLAFDEWLSKQWDESARLFRLSARTVRVDLLARDKQGRAIAIVELKNRPGLSARAAAELRRNIIVHGLRQIPYFLVLSQDKGYLWKPDAPIDTMPQHSFLTRSVIPSHVIESARNGRLTERELEFFVLQWLLELPRKSPEHLQDFENELIRSGFVDAIKDAEILTEAQI